MSFSCPEQTCQMTRMRPRYLAINKTIGGKHALYRYEEHGIPTGTDASTGACQSIALFVPGHGGSHMQVRSFGMETLQAALARQVCVHVYTLSLGGEFSAFDGDVLSSHASSIDATLDLLSQRYQAPPRIGLFVVAHSMGAIAVLESLRRQHHRNLRQNLVFDALLLLSAPVQHPVLACSTSLQKLHHRIRWYFGNLSFAVSRGATRASEERLPAFGSIWGGCRDYMVPAKLSDIEGVLPRRAIALSTSSSRIPGVWTPCDHQSILWCNQLVKLMANAVVSLAALRRDTAEAQDGRIPLHLRIDQMRSALLGTAEADARIHHADGAQPDAAPVHGFATYLRSEVLSDPFRPILDAALLTLLLSASHRAWQQRPVRPVECVHGVIVGILAQTLPVMLMWALAAVDIDQPTGWGRPSALSAAGVPLVLTRLLLGTSLAALLHIAWDGTMKLIRRLRGMRRGASSEGEGSPLQAVRWTAIVAVLLAALAHPALAFLFLAAASPNAAMGSLCLIALAALAPGAASWMMHQLLHHVWLPAACHTSDAQEAALFVMMVATCVPSGCKREAKKRNEATGAGFRLGAALGVIAISLCTSVRMDPWCATSSTSDVLMVVTSGTGILSDVFQRF